MKIKTLAILSAISLAVIITLSGCKKEQPAAPSDQKATTEGAALAEDTAAAATDTQQTVCPVMGGKINKDLFTEYKGKKVYFCCPGCQEQFEKDPGKYISKLPQFKEE